MSKQIIDLSLLQIKLAQSEDEKIEFTNQALKYQLYVSGWCLKEELENILISDNYLDYEVCLAVYDNIPIGVHVVSPMFWANSNFAMFYVKDEFRQNGVATKMLKVMNNKIEKHLMVCYSSQGAGELFFSKVGLKNLKNVIF